MTPLQRVAPYILAVVDACAGNAEARQAVAHIQRHLMEDGAECQALSRAFDRVPAGERDEDVVCEGLSQSAAMILKAILQGISDPYSLRDLLPNEEQN